MSFYNTRSISYFHKAQIRLSKEDVDVEGDLQIALSDSIKSGTDFTNWTNYIRATLAYLNNDVEEVKRLSTCPVLNKDFIRNFIKGLNERGRPDYLKDYHPNSE